VEGLENEGGEWAAAFSGHACDPPGPALLTHTYGGLSPGRLPASDPPLAVAAVRARDDPPRS
jgi:hypothetical protein